MKRSRDRRSTSGDSSPRGRSNPARGQAGRKGRALRKGPALRKALGQHHLRDPALCGPLVDFLSPAGRTVLEVGPGGGVLTRALVAAGATILGWELDLGWALELRRRLGTAALDIVVGDALELPWGRVPRGHLVTGNLPYNVATPILDAVLDQGERFPRSGFLVQLEVARRLAADVGDADYGALSILTRARARCVLLGRVRPGSFHPPPKVESAFVGLEPLATPAASYPALRELVHAAFGRRRKTLRNSLDGWRPRKVVEAVLEEVGLPATTRAEELSLEAFQALLSASANV